MSARLKTEKAFTLVELLVVIAIIVILAGLLFPALSNARAKASAMQCASQLKSLHLYLNMYTSDNQDNLPLMLSDYSATAEQSMPGIVLKLYLNQDWYTSLLANCPAQRKRPNIQKAYNDQYSAAWITYAYNAYASRKKLASIKYPSKMVATFDHVAAGFRSYGSVLTQVGEEWVVGRTIHYGGANYDFMDGHVAWQKPLQILWESPALVPLNNFKYWTGNW